MKTGVVLGPATPTPDIKDRPVSVPDFAATVYHALGMTPGPN
ncbi:MAG: hypothetical protein Ct9H300mP1_03340 [Planctomycetaceae bacterium]|nr:MAG: hypothetical protein Ct9H300mP1_03340 [Planctomycetaceae bacterium]